jgi:hypothetical protein
VDLKSRAWLTSILPLVAGCSFHSLDYLQGGDESGTAAAGGSSADGVGGSAAVEPADAGPDVARSDGGSALVHRYSFDGTGTEVIDSVGGVNGTVMNASLSGSGSLTLAGTTSDQYVDLPNGLVSQLTSVTIEAWVIWDGGADWQRVFDFGDSTSDIEGTQGQGRSYLFLTASSGSTGSGVRAAYKRVGASEIAVGASQDLPSGRLCHVAVVVDGQSRTLSLYRDGELADSAGNVGALSQINDVNNWLGRSQFTSDPELAGTYQEFRIYNGALSEAQIQASRTAGPDATF